VKSSLSQALQRLPGPACERFALLMAHGSMKLELYAPLCQDPQQPHTQDELYIVHCGSGEFVCDGQRQRFTAGDALFVAAGQVHRFENFSNDFVTWVVFWGPPAGEPP
jgi:mannose-6-phosphate isomerase-like protein (cupin superfamily)